VFQSGGVIVRILLVAVIIFFLILWVRAVVDLLRRGDLGVGTKVLWAIGMLVFPFIGLLVYSMLRPTDAVIAQRSPR
jgi:Phospholipase_D-nuclease N-terminal